MDGRWRKGQWRWRTSPMVVVVVAAVWAWACVGVLGETRVRLMNNGYEGVVVGVSQDVEEEHGPALLQAIKETLTQASRDLFTATEYRAYFRTVTILVPREWTNVNATHRHGSENYEDSDIRVDVMHPVYRHQPYTDQPGGCGDPGQYIHLTPTYLLDDTEARSWGSRGKMVVQEWAKYRWGVFDELGYPGDRRFPLTYGYFSQGSFRFGPTLCSNHEVLGRMLDKSGQRGCGSLPSGEPDANCRFIPYPRQTASSSLMSDPTILNYKVKFFCGTDGRPHNTAAPTKHNEQCKRRSVWDVILDHADFKDGANPPSHHFENPTFRVVQQANATYALVLDYSSSMDDYNRILKQQRVARRWLLHQVATGSYVAIINFNEAARLTHGKTQVTDDASRESLANSVRALASGFTSIGAGLIMTVNQVLRNSDNPVILLISDGKENVDPRIDDVIDGVVSSGARVVTVAFGEAADPKLEEVAQRTGGKTFTVIDTDDGQMLEDAFLGALTYQPPQPDTTVTIHDEVYNTSGIEASATFDVDSTVGKDLTLRLVTGVQTGSSSGNSQIISAPVLIGPDGTEHRNAQFDQDSSSWSLTVPLAETGQWLWKVALKGGSVTNVRARVTSLPRNPNVHPIKIKAWASAGSRSVNAVWEKVVIYAKVTQGHNPVVNANVRAFVTPPHEQGPAHVYTLLDNGHFADITAGDGTYSGYMTHYSSNGRYIVRAEVTDGGSAAISSGTTRRRRKRDLQEEEEEQHMDEDYVRLFLDREVCCGSEVPLPPDAPPTGKFQRTASGGSFKVSCVPTGDFMEPARVRDLSVSVVGARWTASSLPTNVSVSISWTAPGDDLDSGIVSGYELRMTDDVKNLEEEKFIVNSSSSPSSKSSGWSVVDLSGLALEVEGGTPLLFNLTLTLTKKTYFALRAWDDQCIVSEVSNIVSLQPDQVHVDPGTGWVRTWMWIVVVAAVMCLLLVVTVVWQKKRGAL